MDQLMGFFSALFWGLLVLSLLVFVHEGGHYLVARACGMRVTEFFLGMPSRLRLSHKSRKYGTEVGVTPILLGGYTRISGMEGEEDELLAPALACVQRHGRVSAARLAEELGCDEDRAYTLLATLSDWGSIRAYYDPGKGEREGQRDWPESFETLERDPNMLTEYDRGHDFSLEGTTLAGEPRPVADADAFLRSERASTYIGKGFLARVATLVAGPAVNLLVAFVLIVVTYAVLGVDVTTATGEMEHVRASLPQAVSIALGYGGRVAQFVVRLIMPQHTMEVLGQSSSVVGISVMASQAAAMGIADLLLLAAAVSTSLGFMNLLPIPPLDGGKILIEVIQRVSHRQVPTRVQNYVSYAGLAFFLFVFVFVVRNDIGRFVLGG